MFAEPASVAGKFFFNGAQKFYIRGVTYGTFRRTLEGDDLPPRSEFGPWLARKVLSIDDVDPTRLLVLHHAVGNPKAAAVLRKMVMERFIKPVGAYIGGADGETRASMIYSHLAGLGMMARLVKLDPIATADREQLIALLGPALQAYIH